MSTACVYVIREELSGALKIGISASPHSRVATLQSGNPRGLEIAYVSGSLSRDQAMAIERAVHSDLARHCIHSEWFGCSLDEAVAAIGARGGWRS